MKKQNPRNQRGFIPFLLAVSLSLPFLVACSSEESVQNRAENARDTYTFTASETISEDTMATRSTMTPQTVTCDLGNGMTLVGILTEESGAVTRSTTPIISGTIYAYVCTPNNIITNVQTIVLKKNWSSFTVNCPSGSSKIHFYIGSNAFSAKAGDNISEISQQIQPVSDYKYASVALPSSPDTPITFHHVFTQAKVTMTSSDASTEISSFNTSVSGIASSTATLYANNATYTVTGGDAALGCYASGGTGTSLSCGFIHFISTSPGSNASATLTVSSITFGGEEYGYSENNTLTFSGTFMQGHRYNFAVTLKNSD